MAFLRALPVLCLALAASLAHAEPPASDADWVKELPVQPGTEAKPHKTQAFFVNKIYGFKFVDHKAWMSGAAYMVLDDGSTPKFTSGLGEEVEVTFDEIAEPVFQQCKAALSAEIPPGMQLEMSGEARYTTIHKTDADAPSSAGKFDNGTLWVFEMFHVSKCTPAKAVTRPPGA